MLSHVLGIIATILATTVWMPQMKLTLKAAKDKTPIKDVSLFTPILALTNSSVWMAYGISMGGYGIWTSIPSLFNIPILILTIAIVHRSSIPPQ